MASRNVRSWLADLTARLAVLHRESGRLASQLERTTATAWLDAGASGATSVSERDRITNAATVEIRCDLVEVRAEIEAVTVIRETVRDMDQHGVVECPDFDSWRI